MSEENEESANPALQPSNNDEKKAVSRPERQQLLLELDMQRQALDMRDERRHDYYLSEPYPPSTEPLSSLDPIHISDLQYEIHHRGKLLVVRALDDGCRIAAVQTVVEDESGTADRLAFFNCDAASDPDKILPEDAIFGIKEPFYTANAECGPCIRIDHPSDLVRLAIDSPEVPSAFRDAMMTPESSQVLKSASNWKADGNAAYKAKDYQAAVGAYTQAVLACGPNDDSIKRDVLRNRSIANTLIRHFEAAQGDAMNAVIPDGQGESTDGLNAKAYYRAGRAAYELRDFQEAESCFKKVLQLTPTDKDAKSELEKIGSRLKEQSTGEYDFVAMSKSSSERHNRLDFADYFGSTEIRQTKGRARGLFATKDFAAGDLILCEKACCVAFASDPEASRTYNLLNRGSKRRSAGTQAILLFNLTQKLLYSPKHAASFFGLYAGEYDERTSLNPVDDRVSVDTFRVNGIIDHNSFACPTVRSSSQSAQEQQPGRSANQSTGLWVRAAYINHACDGNSMRSFMGDMIAVRASKRIAKGDEILHPYLVADPRNEARQHEMRKIFGFTCDCPICVAEATLTVAQHQEQTELVEKLSAILSQHPLPLRQQQDRRTVTQVERLFTRLEALYEGNAFVELPRLGLVVPGVWLSQAYFHNSGIPRDKVLKAALAVLRNCGFGVTFAGQKLTIDRQHAHMSSSAITSAMLAARIYSKQGKTNAPLTPQMEDFARSIYFVMNGELRGFEESFGKI